jgi:hypothetical protein
MAIKPDAEKTLSEVQKKRVDAFEKCIDKKLSTTNEKKIYCLVYL